MIHHRGAADFGQHDVEKDHPVFLGVETLDGLLAVHRNIDFTPCASTSFFRRYLVSSSSSTTSAFRSM